MALHIWLISVFMLTNYPAFSQDSSQNISLNFYGDTIHFIFQSERFVRYNNQSPSDENIQEFYKKVNNQDFSSIVMALKKYKEEKQPDDWLYYQLVRRTAQQISPKQENYLQYTLYKWFFMLKSGYDPLLSAHDKQLLFYMQSDENIYNIPYRIKDGKQYVCLNYHDYGSNIDFNKTKFTELNLSFSHGNKSFSYKIHKLPDFNKTDYVSKNLQFSLNDNEYHFRIKINPEVKTIFANYPTVDYSDYFNIPVSNDTYNSLIPVLKKYIKNLSAKDGVDYLMRFTRYAFVYEPDSQQFGKEKRLTPEQTLLYDGSDCEDRVFLFYYLVKEIYNLPMVVLVYPQHVTIAVKFNKPIGHPIIYNGEAYSICEPTPQSNDLNMGELLPQLKHEKYEVVYVYRPVK